MTLAVATITNSIAALSISGVTIKDKDELKEGWDAYECPLFSPLPNGFMGTPQFNVDSFGTGTGRKLTVFYTLTYRYFHAPVGLGDLETTWSAMVDKVALILYTIFENDAITGSIDLSLVGIGEFGAVADGANNLFHGTDIVFRVTEFVN